MNYYCLIAGLPDLSPDDKKTTFTLADFKNELLELLDTSDVEFLRLIFAQYDNQNFLAFLIDRDAFLQPLGNLNYDDWVEIVQLLKETENPKDKRILPYIQHFYSVYQDEEFWAEGISKEDYLTGLYYDFALQCNNSFLKSWFEFSLNINNLLTAIACRKYGLNPHNYVVGSNTIAQQLRTSNARDYGLTGTFEYLEQVLQIAEEPDLMEREKKIDLLKWQWMDEHTFFYYFSIEKILAYILKMQMIERWQPLTPEKGNVIFRELIEKMKQSVEFEETLQAGEKIR
ncbi:MAG TPA: DUF2764 family protein [Paludibacteraceae bacterium]|nr:DUF2764 family protein [Paludibacteraceae bacterium]HOJ66090.1 DUF2764 family protein [Paludibacteraceae bacterium]HON02095.1 DUF2764 family protein [Paludibacteraceae bacterium]HPD59073.1 DUF2764 family protein [Paludibacteraceae bacterium]HPQ12868.1 DUF2764 family protein [Paludibacteraceae bacterium]